MDLIFVNILRNKFVNMPRMTFRNISKRKFRNILSGYRASWEKPRWGAPLHGSGVPRIWSGDRWHTYSSTFTQKCKKRIILHKYSSTFTQKCQNKRMILLKVVFITDISGAIQSTLKWQGYRCVLGMMECGLFIEILKVILLNKKIKKRNFFKTCLNGADSFVFLEWRSGGVLCGQG